MHSAMRQGSYTLSRLFGPTTHESMLAALTAATVMVATFAKTFVPFYRIGSTPIFVIASLMGVALITASWRAVFDRSKSIQDFILAAAALYALVALNYLILSFKNVPMTYVIGILGFHGLFLIFGFAAARSLRTVYVMLLLHGVIYVAIVADYIVWHGDLMHDGELQDIFGLGRSPLVNALHQHIGNALSLALLAAFGLGSRWARRSALVALPFGLLFMFHIAARGAIFALTGSLLFLFLAHLWDYSKKTTVLFLVIVVLSSLITCALFYNFALRDKNVGRTAPDAVSRTIREIQSNDPEYRLQIWERAWHRILDEPTHIPFGRGIGSYSIDEGFGPPTWLLDKSPKYYPHNSYLEMLYETGIAGLILVCALTLLPLLASLKLWSKFSPEEKAAILIYVYFLATYQVSGGFAYSYDLIFFLAVAMGVIGFRRSVVSLKRKELAEGRGTTAGAGNQVRH